MNKDLYKSRKDMAFEKLKECNMSGANKARRKMI